jgi:S1-C subfamily serine protease
VGANGKTVRRLADLTDQLATAKPNGTVTLSILRDGSRRNVEVGVVDISRS